jgi:hypothetical protein
MNINQANFAFEMITHQRYFNFIIFSVNRSFELQSFWDNINISSSGKKNFSFSDFEIQYRRYQSNIAYSRGNLINEISLAKDGTPPYAYDIFALKINIEKTDYLILAFPFVTMASDIINNFLQKLELDKISEFKKTNTLNLLRLEKEGIVCKNKNFPLKFVELQTQINGDPAISHIKLGGDNPLQSSLYLNYLKTEIVKKESPFIVDHCVFEGEVNLQFSEELKTLTKRQLRTKIHTDNYGNYKLYVHIGGGNVFLLPYFLKQIYSLESLEKVTRNPLLNLKFE